MTNLERLLQSVPSYVDSRSEKMFDWTLNATIELRKLVAENEQLRKQLQDLPTLIEGMSVSVDVSTCDEDAGNRYFGTVTEVMAHADGKHGVVLLVQDAVPNFEIEELKTYQQFLRDFVDHSREVDLGGADLVVTTCELLERAEDMLKGHQ